MNFLLSIVASISAFWLAGEVQATGHTVATWAAYGFSAALLVRGFIEAYLIVTVRGDG